MFPPLPPAMPPWPGSKPPWERTAEVKQSPPSAGQQQQGAGQQTQGAGQQPQNPGQQLQGAQPPGPAFPLRPQVVHGLVPPQLLQPTLPFWITPQYFRAPPQQVPVRQPQQQPRPQVQHQAPPQVQPPQQQPHPQQGQPQAAGSTIQQTPAGPMRVERTEDQSSKQQPFVPVPPVVPPGLPLGARQRSYWTRS
ncbi:MAG TPA: hypothetical protein VD973_14395 [Symbiobacteriaceae bacterium]|nr:hypothetical protein [Symbiobacteriaceae bacterium]